MSGLASVFPPPPPYYKNYNEESWSKVKELLRQKEDIPSELQELAPPPPPSAEQKSYRNFGQIWNVEERLPSLSESGIEQLYKEGCEQSTETLVPELKKLLHSVLIGYLGLVQTLSTDPSQFVSRVESLRILFINMHHLLNTYRPLQSKESLILMMEDQIKTTRQSAEQMRQSNREIGEKISKIASRLSNVSETASQAPETFEEWENYNLDIDLLAGGKSEEAIADEDENMAID